MMIHQKEREAAEESSRNYSISIPHPSSSPPTEQTRACSILWNDSTSTDQRNVKNRNDEDGTKAISEVKQILPQIRVESKNKNKSKEKRKKGNFPITLDWKLVKENGNENLC